MGVAGVGKTTVGRLLASRLGLRFFDADDYHSGADRRKMAAGVALTERDRKPWLRTLARLIPGWEAAGGAVLACSALRAEHRETLAAAAPGQVRFVFLDAEPDLIRARMATRGGHYMPASLLDSQLATLERPTPGEAIHVRADGTPAQIVESALAEIERQPS